MAAQAPGMVVKRLSQSWFMSRGHYIQYNHGLLLRPLCVSVNCLGVGLAIEDLGCFV